jgi:hypothetical protein
LSYLIGVDLLRREHSAQIPYQTRVNDHQYLLLREKLEALPSEGFMANKKYVTSLKTFS